MVMSWLLIFYLGSSCCCTAGIATVESLFHKVVSSYPQSLASTLQTSVTFDEDVSIRCAAGCSNLWPRCSLYCVQGSTCKMFKARISQQYVGMTTATNITFDYCYSSWSLLHDIASSATVTASSSYQSGSINRLPELAKDGIFSWDRNAQCSATNFDDNPWLTMDFGAPEGIEYIRLQLDVTARFNQIIAYLGNDSLMTNNPIFNSPVQPAGDYEILTIYPPNAMSGRYLSFRSSSLNSALCLCEIQVIERQ